MPRSYHEPWGDDALGDAPQAWLPMELSPEEKLVWVGRPHSRIDFAMKELSVGLFGLVHVTFTLFWMTMVVRGGWDRGRVVPAFAWHNLALASCAGLFLLPPGLTMFTAPFRAGMRASKTAYLLTSRRAVVCGPRISGGVAIREFPPRAVGEMRCLEQGDGTGDLILGTRQTVAWWMTQPDGFFAVGEVRAVESLVRKTLAS